MFHARSARQDDKVKSGSGGHLGKHRIGVKCHLASPGHVDGLGKRSHDHLRARAAKEVDGRDRFDFFKTLWQNDEYLGHVGTLRQMCAETHKNPVRPLIHLFGCGYVGRRVAELALAAGHEVSALTRNPETGDELEKLGVRVVCSELSSTAWHGLLEPDGAWVVNTVSAGGRGLAGYEQSYRDGMSSLLAWCRRGNGPAALVYTSSTSVYPQGHDAQIDETAPAEPENETGRILRAAEQLLLEAALPVSRRYVLRLAGIYGPGRHHLLDQLRTGQEVIAGRPGDWLNLIHRDDAARAIWACLQDARPLGGPYLYNVCDGSPGRREEVVAWLASQLGRPAPAFTGEPATGRRQVTPSRRIVAERLRTELHWTPAFPDYRSGYQALLGA